MLLSSRLDGMYKFTCILSICTSDVVIKFEQLVNIIMVYSQVMYLQHF